jgi:eukaryotic-like serine/threonine-protein kinase
VNSTDRRRREPNSAAFSFSQLMNKTRLDQIEEIYHAAADRSPEERASFVEASCGTDDELRREVESLLRYEPDSSGFIDSSPSLLAAEIFSDGDQGPRLLGQTIAHYKVEKLLGEGGMGEVYLAEDSRLHRRVALKVLSKSVIGDAERLARFEREAQAASALNHPNILTVHEFGESEGVHYIASEFVDGSTLRQELAVSGRLNLAKALDMAVQTASALSAAHDAGITHRDIKPENIMVRRDGYVKVLDFGLAKLAQPGATSTTSGSEDATVALHKTKPGAVMGTAGYMSPEQARGKHVDARTDIWSLGAVVYEMITGERPFPGETAADIIVAVLSNEPVPASAFIEGLPPELEWIISKALSKNADARYQTAKELRADLEKIRKRIELEETSAHTPAVQPGATDETARARSTADGGGPTMDEAKRQTDAGVGGTSPQGESSRRPAPAVFLAYFRENRAFGVIAAALVLTLVSSVIYLAFLAPAGEVPIDSIAVLPLENLSGDPDLNYAAEGLSEALIDRLSQLPQLKVISRRSSFQFRGPDVDLREIGARLGARAIVTGSISQMGDELIVRVDVVDASDDRHLAGGQFRRKKTDLPILQNEIARAAVDKLQLKLTDSQTRQIAENSTEDSDAYRYYLSGLVELNGPLGARSRAMEYFEQAVKLDPEFAAAHAEIAWIYWTQANSEADPQKLMPKAKAAAERALAIKPTLAKGHAVQAMVHEYEFDWAAAEREYLRAIDLSPNLDFTRNNYAFFLSVLGRQNEALAQLEEQRARDPLNQRMHLLQKGIVLIQARRFDEALEAYSAAQALDPSKAVPSFIIGYAYAGKRLENEAVAYYKKAVEDLGGEGKYSQPLVYLAATYARMPERREDARRILARIEAMDEYTSPALLAIIYSELGDREKALDLLEKAYIKRDLLLRYIGTAYEYDGLRQAPRFIDLLKRIGLSTDAK